jgi:hypothetical protein
MVVILLGGLGLWPVPYLSLTAGRLELALSTPTPESGSARRESPS